MEKFYSNGKLLLTGEYLVLDGAKSLAIPTKKGQSITIKSIKESKLIWESFDDKEIQWLQVEFDLPRLRIVSESFNSKIENGNDSLAFKLQELLLIAKKLNPKFLNESTGFYIKTKLDFDRNWGLGSSSTLVNNIAQWANIDPFQLQFSVFGGSAYDIACAKNNSPLIYQLIDKKPIIEQVDFNPNFKDQLFFIHLNKKQNSREGITKYKAYTGKISNLLDETSRLTYQILKTNSIVDFEKIMIEHERIIATIIDQKPIQQQLFSDYFGQTKSLGAWGGDFILATGNKDTPNYFEKKGFKTIVPYQEMAL